MNKNFTLLLLLGGFVSSIVMAEVESVKTRRAFNRIVKKNGFVTVYFYTMSRDDEEREVELSSGKKGSSVRYHEVERVKALLSQKSDEDGYGEVVTFVAVNLDRGNLGTLADTYQIKGDEIRLFTDGEQLREKIPVGNDFSLATLEKNGSWKVFDDFVQQEIADRKKAERERLKREKERRRTTYYSSCCGPVVRPYVDWGWGWYGRGWGRPYWGFGFTV